MRLQIKCKHYKGIGETLLLQVNMEDLFDMLDRLKPNVLSSYLCLRMKPAEKEGLPLVDILEEEGTMYTSSVQEVPSTSSGTGEEKGGAL
jgi:hypothetical protein